MQIFLGELSKVFLKRGFLFAIAGLIVLNGFLLYKNETTSGFIQPQAYRQIYNDLKKMPDTQKLVYLEKGEKDMQVLLDIEMSKESGDNTASSPMLQQYKSELAKYMVMYNKGGYLKYTKYIFSEEELYSDTLADYNRVKAYDSYLKSIDANAKQMSQVSIFSNPSTFSYRNIQKTAIDIQALQGRTLSVDISKGVNMVTGFAGTDLIAILLIFYICARLVMNEKEKGLLALVRPTFRGRGTLIRSKLCVVAFSCLFIEAALYAVNFAIAGYLYGFGDLLRSIQSVQGYNGSILQINVLQYFVVFLLTKLAVYVITGFIVLFICVIVKNSATLYVSVAAVIGGECVLYAAIPSYSSLGFFKYINIVNLVFVTPLYNNYLNIDLFGYPVNILLVAGIVGVVLLALFFVASVWIFSYKKGNERENKFSLFVSRLKLPTGGASVHIGNHEWYKLVVGNKAWIVILALLAIQVYGYSQYSYCLSTDEVYYKGYMQKLEGPITAEKTDYIVSEQKRFDDLQNAQKLLSQQFESGKLSQSDYQTGSFALSQSMTGETAFDTVIQRYDYIKSAPSSKKLAFVYDGGYDKIFGNDSNYDDLMSALIMLIALIGLFASVFSSEYSSGAVNLISTCLKGRRHTVRMKLRLCVILTVPVFVICYAPNFINICHYYGFGQLGAPISSLPSFSSMPLSITILGYIIMLYSIRFIAAIVSVLIILFLSQLFKNTYITILISLGIFAGPIILSLLGLSVLDSISLNTLLLGNIILKENILVAVFHFLVPILAGLAAITVTYVRFCRLRKSVSLARVEPYF